MRHGIEAGLLLAFPYFDDRSDELDEKVWDTKQRGVKVVEKVYDEAFDVGAVVILLPRIKGMIASYAEAHLIGHDHEMAVTQTVSRCVILTMLETQDLFDVLDLDILDDLIMSGLSNIKQLASQGEDAVIITADDAQAGDSECFGRVSLGEDESAELSVTTSRVIRVFELDDARDPARRLSKDALN